MLWVLLAIAAIGILLLVLFRRALRRLAAGEATEVERKFETTMRRFRVEIDRFKLTRQGAVKVILNPQAGLLGAAVYANAEVA